MGVVTPDLLHPVGLGKIGRIKRVLKGFKGGCDIEMPPENETASYDRLVEELRALRGVLNAKSFGDESPVLVDIATLKTQMQHVQTSMKELKTALWGIAAGVLGLVIKMVIEVGLSR